MKEVHLFRNNNFLSFYFTFLSRHGDLHYFSYVFIALFLHQPIVSIQEIKTTAFQITLLLELVKKLFKYT